MINHDVNYCILDTDDVLSMHFRHQALFQGKMDLDFVYKVCVGDTCLLVVYDASRGLMGHGQSWVVIVLKDNLYG